MLAFLHVAALVCIVLPRASGSSHSEAPGTARAPTTDLTDFYTFMTRRGNVAFVLNTRAFQQSQGGPNYSPLSNDVVYNIHVDRDGDAREDVTFQFLFGTRLANNGRGIELNVNGHMTPLSLSVAGPISFSNGTTKNTNYEEYYRMRVQRGDDYGTSFEESKLASRFSDTGRRARTTEFIKAFDNVGTKTFPGTSYDDYVRAAAIYPQVVLPGCAATASLFVGPRRDSFGIALGEVFDLLSIDGGPLEPNTRRRTADFDGNSLDRFGVTSIVLEVPQICLLPAAQTQRVLGTWASVTKLEHRDGGHYSGKQLNRLGNPLVNELLIGLAYKNEWNSRPPRLDSRYVEFFKYPSFPAVVELLFSSAGVTAPTRVRDEVVAGFLTGVGGPIGTNAANIAPNGDGVAPLADLLRINLATATFKDCSTQQRLSLLARATDGTTITPDIGGWPNGRRLGDDVVDIITRIAMGALCHPPFDALLGVCHPSDAPAGALRYTDKADVFPCWFNCNTDDFPFLNRPLPGDLEFAPFGVTKNGVTTALQSQGCS